MRRAVEILVVLCLVSGCGPSQESRQYPVKGQILRIDPARQEVLVSHENIPGFMSAMTMPYKVKDAALLKGKEPGDLFTATLVFEEVVPYLSTLTRIGHAPIESSAVVPLIAASDLLKEGEQVPDHALVDQNGTPSPMTLLRGHRVALTFMYTRCPLPEFCPLMDRHFAQVQKVIKSTPELADVRLVSVTLDPQFDTSAVLKAHAQALQADPFVWHFLTGAPDELLAFAKRFGVTAELGEPGDMMVHNLRTAVIDAEGYLVKTYSGTTWTPSELVADLEATPAPAH